MMLALAVYYAAGLALFGLDLALPIGVFTGLAVFVPYLGFGLGSIIGSIVASLFGGFMATFNLILVLLLVAAWLATRIWVQDTRLDAAPPDLGLPQLLRGTLLPWQLAITLPLLVVVRRCRVAA